MPHHYGQPFFCQESHRQSIQATTKEAAGTQQGRQYRSAFLYMMASRSFLSTCCRDAYKLPGSNVPWLRGDIFWPPFSKVPIQKTLWQAERKFLLKMRLLLDKQGIFQLTSLNSMFGLHANILKTNNIVKIES